MNSVRRILYFCRKNRGMNRIYSHLFSSCRNVIPSRSLTHQISNRTTTYRNVKSAGENTEKSSEH
ncbi:hypothetical protein RhiirB3_419881 [Rhizophagus irregularis]|nr:hypothetical protein RhiirB3_419881 [Rhizophagus irregularis]